jgi:alpha-L-fucosidase
MKGPFFTQKYYSLENTELFTLKVVIPYFITVHWNEDPSPQAIASNASLKRFTDYLETLQNNHPELVTFDCWIKNDVETGMYFDSSIPQGYGVGSSGALVAAIYDRCPRQNYCSREFNSWKVIAAKIYSLKWKAFFTEKFRTRSFK